MFSSNTDDWRSPDALLKDLNKEFDFDFDPCPFHSSFDGRTLDTWQGNCMFVNPPYSKIGKNGKKQNQLASRGKPGTPKYFKGWVEKGFEESQKGKTVVMLLPARTDTSYFHDYILPNAEIRFIRGRLKFSDHYNPAPFPSMVVIFRGPKQEK